MAIHADVDADAPVSLQELSNRLAQLKTKVDELTNQRARIQGRIDAVSDTLRTKFGVSTVENAEKVLDGLKRDMDLLRQELSEKLEELSGYVLSVRTPSR